MSTPETAALAFFSVEQVADLLGCEARTVLELVRRGELRGARFGKAYRFHADDILAAYQARANAAGGEQAKHYLDPMRRTWPPELP